MAVDAAGAVLTERDGAVLVLTMNRPDRLNALARPLREAVHAALVDAMADDGVRAIVLTGAGRAFSAGGDLDEITTVDDLDGRGAPGLQPARALPRRGARSRSSPRSTAPAAGAGFGLALCCDLRVMADDAFVAVAFAGIGLVPDTGVSWTLPRLVGPARAYDLAVTGRRVRRRGGRADRARRPRRAARRGRVDGALARRRPGPRARALRSAPRSSCCARRPAARSPRRSRPRPSRRAAAAAHADFAEGVAAFRERRPPRLRVTGRLRRPGRREPRGERRSRPRRSAIVMAALRPHADDRRRAHGASAARPRPRAPGGRGRARRRHRVRRRRHRERGAERRRRAAARSGLPAGGTSVLPRAAGLPRRLDAAARQIGEALARRPRPPPRRSACSTAAASRSTPASASTPTSCGASTPAGAARAAGPRDVDLRAGGHACGGDGSLRRPEGDAAPRW